MHATQCLEYEYEYKLLYRTNSLAVLPHSDMFPRLAATLGHHAQAARRKHQDHPCGCRSIFACSVNWHLSKYFLLNVKRIYTANSAFSTLSTFRLQCVSTDRLYLSLQLVLCFLLFASRRSILHRRKLRLCRSSFFSVIRVPTCTALCLASGSSDPPN